jgi:uncharacterized protein (DUF2236 family)
MHEQIQKAVARELAAILGDDPQALEEYAYPLFDKGLFGPGSIVWRVHADLPSMLIGGISSLMLQSLHPLAMAAVADHSSYKTDPLTRLQKTARFVAGTTFGSIVMAEQLTSVVKSVHDAIQGVTQDQRHYSASDPKLLTFVHIAEVSSFLRAYQRYSLSPLTTAEIDNYYSEVSLVAEMLGANNVPKSLTEVKLYFKSIRQELAATSEAKEALNFLRSEIDQFILNSDTKTNGGGGDSFANTFSKAATVRIRKILTEASFDLLFYWAKDLFKQKPTIPTAILRPATLSLCSSLRWAIGPSKVEKIASLRSRGIDYKTGAA